MFAEYGTTQNPERCGQADRNNPGSGHLLRRLAAVTVAPLMATSLVAQTTPVPTPPVPQYEAPQYAAPSAPAVPPAPIAQPTTERPLDVLPFEPTPFDATSLGTVPLATTPDDLSGIEYDERVADVLDSTRELELIYHRSRLVRTKKRISRIQVTDPGVVSYVQYTPNELTIIGQNFGTTDVTMWFEGEEDNPLLYSVRVIRDPALDDQRRLDYGKIERKLALLYPNSKVYLIPMSQKIIVRGQASDPKEAANIMEIVRGEIINQDGDLFRNQFGNDFYGAGGGFAGGAGIGRRNGLFDDDVFSSLIVDELEVPGEFQIMVRVRIAELSRSQLRRYGVDWSFLFGDGAHAIAQSFAAATPVLTGIFENGEINVLIDALASNGTAKVMEDSVLTVISGDSASFLSGGEFAVPTTVGLGGAAAATTTFRGFGVSLIATPTVIDHDLIRMFVVPELSSVNQGNAVGGVPGLNVNRVQTRVELREGQTIVLGGLFSRQQQTEVTRIPLLGEIPIVGKLLFNAKSATEDEKEMLIIVTPEIVRPMDPEDVPPMPGFYVTHPDQFDFCEFNRTEGNPDLGHYRLMPIGRAMGYGQDQGYSAAAPATAFGAAPGVPAGPEILPQGTPLPGGPQPIEVPQTFQGPAPQMAPGVPTTHQQRPAYAPAPQFQQQPVQPAAYGAPTIQRGPNQAAAPQQRVVPANGFVRRR